MNNPVMNLPQQSNVMIVDDTLANVQILLAMLRKQGYKVRPVLSGKQALEAAKKSPPDLILLDISMPEMDGYEVCQRLRADPQLKDIPVIFISALTDVLDKVKAFSMGGVDYITKPFQLEEVRARVETHLQLRSLRVELEQHNLHLQELVQEQVKEISDSQMATIMALAKLAERRDDDTGKHIERVQVLCKLLASRLSQHHRQSQMITPAFIDNIYYASPLHDIGKVGIVDSILLKPARLTPEEFDIMKQHTVIGAQTLEAVRENYPKNSFISMGIELACFHHEKWDGSGYPQGLRGEAIPLSARILAVVDVYDALCSVRPYKPAYEHEKSCDIIYKGSAMHFDPEIVQIFNELEAEFKDVREALL